MDAIAADLGLDRTVVRERNFIAPRGDALRPRAGLPGRPAAGLRLRRLPGLAGDAEAAGRLGRLRGGAGRGARRGAHASGSGWPATSRAPASAPTRAGTSGSRPTAASSSPPASPPRARATGRCSRRSSPTSSACRSSSITVTTGDTRRFKYAVGTFASRTAVMSGSAVALTARKVREKALRHRRPGARGRGRRPRDRRRARPGRGRPRVGRVLDRPRRRRRPLEPAPLRVRRGGRAGHPVRRPRRPRAAAGGRGGVARAGGHRVLLTAPLDVRQRHARGGRGDRPGDGRDQDPALLRRPRLRHAGQPDDRRGPDPRRGGPGRRRRALRADGVRRATASC